MIGWMMLAAAQAATAPAQGMTTGEMHASRPCPAGTTASPPDLAGWSAMAPLAAGTHEANAPPLPLGRSVRATLAPTGTITFAAAPAYAGASNTFGGMFALWVSAKARYRLSLGAGAWVDVVQAGKALPSAGHAHGPDCSGISKMVDYDLAPGHYLVEVAGNAAPTLGVMATRVAG